MDKGTNKADGISGTIEIPDRKGRLEALSFKGGSK